MNPKDYPEHVKLFEIEGNNSFDVVKKAFDWLLLQYDVGEITGDKYEPGFDSCGMDSYQLTCKYFGINASALRTEKEKMTEVMESMFKAWVKGDKDGKGWIFEHDLKD